MPGYLAILGFALAWLLTPLLVCLQARWGLGQPIRDYGPNIHNHKRGTPTFGGVALLVAWLVLLPLAKPSKEVLLMAGTALGFGLIGLLDDGLKARRRHAQGLRPRYKLLGQALVSLAFLAGLLAFREPEPLRVPFLAQLWALGPLAYGGLALLVFLGTVNAVNETDGLDGLAVGTSLVTLLALSFIVVLQGRLDWVRYLGLAVGSLLGFLWWNAHPARIFLGDTGAFALGGLIAALALLTGTALFLPLLALVPTLETLSVIVQVISFKLFRTRVFKVAPLHHHFERARGVDYRYLLPNREWPEPLITVRFWIVALLGAALGLWLYWSR